MRAVIQRVSGAGVSVDGRRIASIGPGLVVLVGVDRRDGPEDADQLASKTVHLRVFDDEDGKLNRSLIETRGELLCVSQFTLLGDCRRGRRPSFTNAARPDPGLQLFQKYVDCCRKLGVPVDVGQFGAKMKVELACDGPVTLLLDTRGENE